MAVVANKDQSDALSAASLTRAKEDKRKKISCSPRFHNWITSLRMKLKSQTINFRCRTLHLARSHSSSQRPEMGLGSHWPRANLDQLGWRRESCWRGGRAGCVGILQLWLHQHIAQVAHLGLRRWGWIRKRTSGLPGTWKLETLAEYTPAKQPNWRSVPPSCKSWQADNNKLMFFNYVAKNNAVAINGWIWT